MNSGAESLLVRKAKGLRHLFAAIAAMLTDQIMTQFEKPEQLESGATGPYVTVRGVATLVTSAHVDIM